MAIGLSRRDSTIVARHEVPGAWSLDITEGHVGRFCHEVEGAASRRDGAIVARHEVPGKASSQENRPVGYGMIRAAERTDSSDWRIE
jgi:hypothetical protein